MYIRCTKGPTLNEQANFDFLYVCVCVCGFCGWIDVSVSSSVYVCATGHRTYVCVCVRFSFTLDMEVVI